MPLARPLPLAALLLGTLPLPSAPAHGAEDAVAVDAPPPCAERRAIERQLAAGYGEAPVSAGVRSDGSLLQVFASSESGSWTLVSVAPDGLACVLAVGRGWESATPPGRDPAA